jgi:hypothetical protein
MSDATEQHALIVGGFQIAASEEDLMHVVVRLSSTREGPHYHFLFDAPTLDQLARALTDAAAKIRKRAS